MEDINKVEINMRNWLRNGLSYISVENRSKDEEATTLASHLG